MLQAESEFIIADNTGAKSAKMIRRLGQLKDTASVGDVVVCSIQSSKPEATVKKGTVVRALIVRTKAPIHREDGSVLRFDDNAGVIIKEDGSPRGTRVFGPVARELRSKKQNMKIISLAPEVL